MHPYFFRIYVVLHEAEAVHIDPGGKVEIPTESDPPCPEVPPIVGVQLFGGTSDKVDHFPSEFPVFA